MRRNILLIAVALGFIGCAVDNSPEARAMRAMYSAQLVQQGLTQAGGAYSQNLETQRRIYEAYKPAPIQPYVPPVYTPPRSFNCFSYGGNTICQ